MRRLLAYLPPGLVVRVVRGPLRGRKWVVGAAPHGAWLGRIEPLMLSRFVALLRPDSVVWDIGANVGLYTLAAAPRAARVVAFEPLPRNLALLRRHLALNNMTNVEIVEAAVGTTDGTVHLSEGDSPSVAWVTPDGALTVTALSLDEWVKGRADPAPDVVKIDVEGAEMDVLTGGQRSLTHGPAIILAVHSPDLASQCLAWLHGRGYRVEGSRGESPDTTSDWIAQRP